MEQKSEKYSSWLQYWVGVIHRIYIRSMVQWMVSWSETGKLASGCTVIIGMCSRLPDLLPANLSCLRRAQWPDLKEVIIVLDAPINGFSESFAVRICEEFKDLNVRFLFYTRMQSAIADLLKRPYVYSWLSWALAIKDVRTDSFYIHHCDALLLDNVLQARYLEFKKSQRRMQGIQWYSANGIVSSDRLVSAFEAFVDTKWIRKLQPIEMLNRVGWLDGRRIDYDFLLDIQKNYCQLNQRGVVEMSQEEMVHPTQMICQYTAFRTFPNKPMECAALVMIPLFYYLSGRKDVFAKSSREIDERRGKTVELLSDGCMINFEKLRLASLNRMLLLMVQAFIALGIEPFGDFLQYSQKLYSLIDVSDALWWQMSMSDGQKRWIDALRKIV